MGRLGKFGKPGRPGGNSGSSGFGVKELVAMGLDTGIDPTSLDSFVFISYSSFGLLLFKGKKLCKFHKNNFLYLFVYTGETC
jgi:hypothetical protein